MSTIKTTESGRPVMNPARMAMAQGLSSAARTPVSGYLDEYIAAEIECMTREVGGWRRCRSPQGENRLFMDWIRKNAQSFRARWDHEHQVAGG